MTVRLGRTWSRPALATLKTLSRLLCESISRWSRCISGIVQVVSVPICVREVCEGCFEECKSFRRVIFSESSHLERICAKAFCGTSIESVCLPDSVVELREKCFHECESLSSVTFGASSKLERICCEAFYGTSIESLCLPDSVVELCERCFYKCKRLRRVIFSASSHIERICAKAFSGTKIESLCLPASVIEVVVLHLVHRLNLNVSVVKHFVVRVLSLSMPSRQCC